MESKIICISSNHGAHTNHNAINFQSAKSQRNIRHIKQRKRQIRIRTTFLIGLLIGLAFLLIARANTNQVSEPLVINGYAAEITEPEATEPSEANDIFYDVPKAETGQKTFMDFRTITNKDSDQYKIQKQAWTDDYGFRRYDNYYLVAMGTYYADKCGKKFEITLDNGTVFQAMIGDIKQDKHTDELHQHRNGNVIEFIVDGDTISDLCWYHGDMSYSDGVNFKGKIITIKEIEV